MSTDVAILGVVVVDTTYHSLRLPTIGETIKSSGFSLGPGGKGSNQAIAAAMAGATTTFISKIGRDAFGEMAIRAYEKTGVTARLVEMADVPTGAAFVFVDTETADNAIMIFAGAAGTLTTTDVENARNVIEHAKVFVTQLEQPVEVAERSLAIARAAGVKTILNPAPAERLPETIYSLCDFIIPNETEAAALVGFEFCSIDDVRRAAASLLGRGARACIITLGARGVLYHSTEESVHVPAISFGRAIDTAGAGDAFVGGFAAALSKGVKTIESVRFGSVAAGIAVTRRGTAFAMPAKREIEAVLASL